MTDYQQLFTVSLMQRCPDCKRDMTLDECEVAGAEDGNVFCPFCYREFHVALVKIERQQPAQQRELFGETA